MRSFLRVGFRSNASRRLDCAALTCCAALLITLAGSAGSVRAGDDDERFVVVKAGRIIPVVGKEVTDGMIVIVNGKIRSIGKGLEYPTNAKVIDASDRVVMPALINPYSRYGLSGYDRSGVRSNLNAIDEFFPNQTPYTELLASGYTVLGLYPEGSGVPGRGAVVRVGGPADQRTLKRESFMRVLPDKPIYKGGLEKAQAEIDKVDKAKKEFEEQQKKAAAQPPPAAQPAASQPPVSQPTGSQPASAPASAPAKPAFQPPPIDPPHQGLVDLIQKHEGLFALLQLRNASDYLQMLDAQKKYDFPTAFVLRNGVQSDFFRIQEKLGEKKSRVVVWPLVNRVPFSVERVPIVAQLTKAGCEVSLAPLNDSLDEHLRILQRTAELVREGWSREDALKALTLNPAKLLGIESRLGSIEKDREADLIFLDADPFKAGAAVREVMIGGEIVRRAPGATQ